MIVGVFESAVDEFETMYSQSAISPDFVRVFQMHALLGVSLKVNSSTFVLSASDFYEYFEV